MNSGAENEARRWLLDMWLVAGAKAWKEGWIELLPMTSSSANLDTRHDDVRFAPDGNVCNKIRCYVEAGPSQGQRHRSAYITREQVQVHVFLILNNQASRVRVHLSLLPSLYRHVFHQTCLLADMRPTKPKTQ